MSRLNIVWFKSFEHFHWLTTSSAKPSPSKTILHISVVRQCRHAYVCKAWSTWDFQQCGVCNQQRLRPACAYAQSDQSLCKSLEDSMTNKLLPKHHFEFLSLKGGCTGSSESTLVKMSHCWKSHVTAQYRVVQELWVFSLTANGRTDRQTDSHSGYSEHLLVMQEGYSKQ